MEYDILERLTHIPIFCPFLYYGVGYNGDIRYCSKSILMFIENKAYKNDEKWEGKKICLETEKKTNKIFPFYKNIQHFYIMNKIKR